MLEDATCKRCPKTTRPFDDGFECKNDEFKCEDFEAL